MRKLTKYKDSRGLPVRYGDLIRFEWWGEKGKTYLLGRVRQHKVGDVFTFKGEGGTWLRRKLSSLNFDPGKDWTVLTG